MCLNISFDVLSYCFIHDCCFCVLLNLLFLNLVTVVADFIKQFMKYIKYWSCQPRITACVYLLFVRNVAVIYLILSFVPNL